MEPGTSRLLVGPPYNNEAVADLSGFSLWERRQEKKSMGPLFTKLSFQSPITVQNATNEMSRMDDPMFGFRIWLRWFILIAQSDRKPNASTDAWISELKPHKMKCIMNKKPALVDFDPLLSMKKVIAFAC